MENKIVVNQRDKSYKTLKNSQGYIVLEHRHTWENHFGKIPKGMVIHHINGNKKDNKIENLQMVTVKQHGELHQKPNRIRIKYTSGTKVIKIPLKPLSVARTLLEKLGGYKQS